MKDLEPSTIRLMQAGLETRDALRRLVSTIDAAGEDPKRQAEALAAARHVAITYADVLRLALKDSGARRHDVVTGAPRCWARGRR